MNGTSPKSVKLCFVRVKIQIMSKFQLENISRINSRGSSDIVIVLCLSWMCQNYTTGTGHQCTVVSWQGDVVGRTTARVCAIRKYTATSTILCESRKQLLHWHDDNRYRDAVECDECSPSSAAAYLRRVQDGYGYVCARVLGGAARGN